MRTTWKIFRRDIRRLTSSVVAVVVIMGLCLVPCLYAWFNIFSNWDPYGQSATSRITVAVASEDTGAELMGIDLNIGSMVLSGLEANRQMGWVFVDNRAAALDGVRAGDYYAALIVPDGFSESFLSVLTGEPEHPQIEYYENDKKNAIAPKITNKAKTAVQDQINNTIIGTLADSLRSVSSLLRAMGLTADDVAQRLTGRLDTASADLAALGDTLRTLQSTVREADSLLACADVVVDDAGEVLTRAGSAVASAAGDVPDSGAAADLLEQMNDADAQLGEALDTLRQAQTDAETWRQFLADGAAPLTERADALHARLTELSQSEMLAQHERIRQRLTDAADRADALCTALHALTDDSPLEALGEELLSQTDEAREELRLAAAELGGGVDEALGALNDRARQSLSDVEGLLGSGEEKMTALSGTLSQLNTALSQGGGSLSAAIELTDAAAQGLSDLSGDVTDLFANPTVREMLAVVEDSPDSLADYLSQPVALETVPVYEITSYGSAMAPYYIMLALFVGSLLCVTMVRVPMTTLPDGVTSATLCQRYFGRFALFFCVGMVQALITGLGCVYYIGMQCLHPGLFLLGCCICSLNFAMMNYALVYALDNVGMAASVIIMVLQVAGSGGTYPIDVLPPIFRKLYVCMPFRYGMDLLRETIAGMYGSYYLKNALILLGMCVPFTLFGLLAHYPFRRLNARIADSKAASGLM
jgi:putative membrane protein